MKCEKFSKLLPDLRALIAKELVINYNYSQEEVARIMNVTQGAVSQYIRGVRGKRLSDNKSLVNLVKELCENVKNGSNFEEELCKLCKKINFEFFA